MLSSIVRDRRVGCNFWIINFLTTGGSHVHISCGRRGSCDENWSPNSSFATENTYNDNDWQTYASYNHNDSYESACDCMKRKTQIMKQL